MIGGVLLVPSVAAFFADRLVHGKIGWRNAWGQPITIYLVVATLVTLAVIWILDVLVWRKQRDEEQSKDRHHEHGSVHGHRR